MAFVPPNKDINEILKAFGLDKEFVTSFKLNIEIDAVVSIEVKMYPDEESLKKLVPILKKYELVEKKDIGTVTIPSKDWSEKEHNSNV